MTLPVPTRTWNISPNNRVTYSTADELVQHELLGVKNYWVLGGLAVVGSSNGAVRAFDGVDRWGAAADVQEWMVLEAESMGAQILLAPNGSNAKIAFSLSGYQLISGQPWAADEQVLSDDALDVGDGQGDRLWSAGYSSDLQAVWFFLARARSVHRFVFLQRCDSTVSAPATFAPPVVGFSLDNRGLEAKDFVTKAKGRALVNGVACPLYIGGEAYGGAGLAVEVQSAVMELQGSGYLVQPLSLWSEALGARGKVGNLIDVWAGVAALSDGDVLPDDGTLQMISVGQLIIPWDGLTQPVLV